MAIKKIQPRYRPLVMRIVWDEIPKKSKPKKNRFATDSIRQLCGRKDDGLSHFMGCFHEELSSEMTLSMRNLNARSREDTVEGMQKCGIVNDF